MSDKICIVQLGKMDSRVYALLLSAVYLFISYYLSIIKLESIALVCLYNIFLWVSPQTRRLMLALTIFLIFGILYDLMRVFPNYNYNAVDIKDIYHFEKAYLGVSLNGETITFNEYFVINNSIVLDLLTGIFYLNWMPVPLAFGIYLFYKNKKSYLNFSLSFLLINLIGFALYYIYPAAPPWYVDLHGFEFHVTTSGNAAGFIRFDELINLPVFDWIYRHNSNVFAAVPSLHCAYPIIVLYYGIKNKIGHYNWLLGIFMVGIWFSAVYSGHHYIIDVILGIVCAVIGLMIYEYTLLNLRWYQSFLNKYYNLIDGNIN